MKQILYILIFMFSFSTVSLAQSQANGGERLREKMVEYIETKLALTKAESEKFEPIFNDYLKQMRATRQEYKSDRILLQQKMAELRVRTRDQLKPIIGETRSNEVFKHEHDFVEKAKEELKDRIEERRANKKTG